MSYRRSGTRSKRGQQTYLSNPKAIAHIARKVDEAIDLASQTGAVNSFADLKELVEAHSAETSKHPVGMELCEVDGAIRGFRFYLQSDPSQTISGKHLAIKAGSETYDYTPSAIADHLGFDPQAEEEFAEDLAIESELDGELNDLDFNEELSVDDLELLDELSNLEPATEPQPQKRSQRNKQTLQEKQSQRNKQTPQDKKPSRANPSRQSGKSKDYNYRQHPIERVAESARHTANIGSDLNGLNEAGLITQLATLGVAVTGLGLQELTQLLEEAKRKGQEKRLQKILETLQQQNERVHDLGSRLAELRSPRISSTVKEDETEEEVLSSVTNQVTERVNRLGSDLDKDYKPLPPIKLDPDADINKKLDQIEDYLNLMVRAIDGLEQRLTTLEATVHSPQAGLITKPEIETEDVSTSTTTTPDQPVEDAKINATITSNRSTSDQVAIADRLLELAAQSDPDGAKAGNQIVDLDDRLLFVEKTGDVLSVSLEDSKGEILFAAVYKQDEWTVQKPLSEADRTILLNRLQEPQDTPLDERHEKLAQQFIRYAQNQLPELFNDQTNSQEPPEFSLETPDGKTYAYDFKLHKLLTNKQHLLGFDRNRDQQKVFDALLHSNQEAQVRVCDIPADVLEPVVQDAQAAEQQVATEREKSAQNFELD